MKIAVIFSSWAIGSRALDFNILWTDSRGLSGSDLAVCKISSELVKLNCEIHLFTVHKNNKPDIWQGVKLFNIDEINKIDKTYDAVISFNDPHPLKNIPKSCIKIVNQLLNDFDYCEIGFDEYVDLWLAPCEMQKERLQNLNKTNKNKWSVLSLGVDIDVYKTDVKRIDGSVIWLSSCDRGLQNLLQIWPNIKAEVPEANLRIFYNYNFDMFDGINLNSSVMKELNNRAKYCKIMIQKLKHLDVNLIGSVSRDKIEQVLSESKVLAYPCSTVKFTEGFSLSILESCGSGCLPIISKTDALDSIYSDVVPCVDEPVEKYLDEYKKLVINALTNEKYRSETAEKCKKFAKKYNWAEIAGDLINKINNYKK